jgi:hypothetical protein
MIQLVCGGGQLGLNILKHRAQGTRHSGMRQVEPLVALLKAS